MYLISYQKYSLNKEFEIYLQVSHGLYESLADVYIVYCWTDLWKRNNIP